MKIANNCAIVAIALVLLVLSDFTPRPFDQNWWAGLGMAVAWAGAWGWGIGFVISVAVSILKILDRNIAREGV